MKVYDTSDIRNVALVGHGDSGKTTLASAFLFVAGAVKRLGRTEDGTATTDFDDEEIQRKISLQTATAHLEWGGTKINLLDTPGYAAFVADAKAGVAVADAALILVEAVAGIQVLTARTFRFAGEYDLPTVFVVNKLDRENADFDRVLGALQARFGRETVAVQLPIGRDHGFCGVIDLVTLTAHRYSVDASGTSQVEPIPAELADEARRLHGALVEAVAETDDQLMEAYFESGDLTGEQLTAGLRNAIRLRRLYPVVCSSASTLVGPRSLLDLIVGLLPAPGERGPVHGTNPKDESPIARPVADSEPIALFTFKTIAEPYAGRLSLFRVMSGILRADSHVVNARTETPERLGPPSVMQGKTIEAVEQLHAGDIGVVAKLKETHTSDTLCDAAHPIRFAPIAFPAPSISFAVEPKSKGDEEKISTALVRLTEEDPVLRFGRDPRTHELLVSGTSQVHVEVAIQKMRKKFGVDAILKQPKVPYLETIKKRVGPIEGKHKKQSGGRGQFGVCVIEMEPTGRGGGYEFVDKIFGGSIPHNFRPAVDKGIQESAVRGVIAGFPVVDFRVTLVDGKYHDVDSSEMAFKIAGSLAFKEGVQQAKPTLLEPLMAVEITAPEEYMGEIMGDLSARRGKPQGIEPHGTHQMIKALVPMAEMLTYASTLKSITSDRGSYQMEFDHYDEVPAQIQSQIVAQAEKSRDGEGG